MDKYIAITQMIMTGIILVGIIVMGITQLVAGHIGFIGFLIAIAMAYLFVIGLYHSYQEYKECKDE
jgi:Ca2+/Na+ antiporter